LRHRPGPIVVSVALLVISVDAARPPPWRQSLLRDSSKSSGNNRRRLPVPVNPLRSASASGLCREGHSNAIVAGLPDRVYRRVFRFNGLQPSPPYEHLPFPAMSRSGSQNISFVFNVSHTEHASCGRCARAPAGNGNYPSSPKESPQRFAGGGCRMLAECVASDVAEWKPATLNSPFSTSSLQPLPRPRFQAFWIDRKLAFLIRLPGGRS
jgi:hypothetical protein